MKTFVSSPILARVFFLPFQNLPRRPELLFWALSTMKQVTYVLTHLTLCPPFHRGNNKEMAVSSDFGPLSPPPSKPPEAWNLCSLMLPLVILIPGSSAKFLITGTPFHWVYKRCTSTLGLPVGPPRPHPASGIKASIIAT